VLVCAGAILIATFGAMKEPAHNLDQLLDLLGRRAFVLWMIGQAILVALIVVAAKLMKMLYPRASGSPCMRLSRGIAYGCVRSVKNASIPTSCSMLKSL
jgi:hypothetical protein